MSCRYFLFFSSSLWHLFRNYFEHISLTLSLQDAKMIEFKVYSVLLIIFGIWLVILSTAFYWLFSFFKRLSGKTKESDLIKVLTKILKAQEANSQELSLIQKEIARLEKEGQLYVQKIGVVRFNPFAEIGGDHSFSLALLNGQDSGVIVTCLHTRERTRVYLKTVKRGKCEYELSDEEKKALKVAQRS